MISKHTHTKKQKLQLLPKKNYDVLHYVSYQNIYSLKANDLSIIYLFEDYYKNELDIR